MNRTRYSQVRLFAGDLLYGIFFCYRAILGRIAHLFLVGKNNNRFTPWKNDKGIASIVANILDQTEIDEFRQLRGPNYSWLTRAIENKFIANANKIIDGHISIDSQIEQGVKIIDTVSKLQQSNLL